MAIQTRYAGDALPVINMDAGLTSPVTSINVPISTGLTKSPIALVVAHANVGVATEMVTGGAVETILRTIGTDSTITAYQVDAGQISILLEATGAGGSAGVQGGATITAGSIVTAIQARLRALTGAALGTAGPTGTTTGGNIGISANVNAGSLTVTNVGIKFATS